MASKTTRRAAMDAEMRIVDALEAQLHALLSEDDFAGGLPVVEQYRRLEGWNDDPSRVPDAHRRVRLATGAANAALDRAVRERGE